MYFGNLATACTQLEDKMAHHLLLRVEDGCQTLEERCARLKQVGQEARLQAKELLGMPAHLMIHVKVLSDWQRDPKHLNRLGF